MKKEFKTFLFFGFLALTLLPLLSFIKSELAVNIIGVTIILALTKIFIVVGKYLDKKDKEVTA